MNSAHPFENPTPLTNFLELLAILLIPGGPCYTFGRMVKDTRQGWALLAAMFLLFSADGLAVARTRAIGNPLLSNRGRPGGERLQPDGNMEGKEVRFGTSTRPFGRGHDRDLQRVGQFHARFLSRRWGAWCRCSMMQLGEVIFGGVGTGPYGMLAFVIVAVFVAGLMVGRTPEYLGKKIQAFEMKMASIVILHPGVVLIGTASRSRPRPAGRRVEPGRARVQRDPLRVCLLGNNNGSAFAGINGNSPFYNVSPGP